jgi:hypothetical protein
VGQGRDGRRRLTDASGTPVRGAVVTLIETPALPGAKPAATTTATTDANGRSSHPPNRADGEQPDDPGDVRRRPRRARRRRGAGPLAVTAAVKLAVTLKGVVVPLHTGRVLSKPLPAGGKLVVVQGRVRGGSWQTFATRRATRNGGFSGRYRLRARTPGRVLQFRARVVAESGYAYRPATSRAVSRTVR